MFDFFMKPKRLHQTLKHIRWIETTTEAKLVQPLTNLQAEHQELKAIAQNVSDKADLIGDMYEFYGQIESAQIQANQRGIKALGQVQQKRKAYRSMRGRLLKGK